MGFALVKGGGEIERMLFGLSVSCNEKSRLMQ